VISIVADVHGATAALRHVAASGGPLLVLGDLINFIDYRTHQGIVTEVSGEEIVGRFIAMRMSGDHDGAGRLWRQHARGREAELRARNDEVIVAAYTDVLAAREGCDAYVTYGNVDRPDLLASMLPRSARFVDGEVIEIEGLRIGFAGGGTVSINTPGEVSDADMAAKLADLSAVDVLCTHVPPAVEELAADVIAGRQKGSPAVLDYIQREQPPFHYFGDIHQPRAATWRIGRTKCINVGYFRATGRAVHHR
jgi:Icc-related predicted phosphoesterase